MKKDDEDYLPAARLISDTRKQNLYAIDSMSQFENLNINLSRLRKLVDILNESS